MTNEKIFANEILTDEQLDNVNGGFGLESVTDILDKIDRWIKDKLRPSLPRMDKAEVRG